MSSLCGRPLFEKSVIEWTKFLVAWEDLFRGDLKRMKEKHTRHQEVLRALLSRETYVDIVGQLHLSGKTLKRICEKKSWGMLNKALNRAKSSLRIPQKQGGVFGWSLKESTWWLLQRAGTECVPTGLLTIFTVARSAQGGELITRLSLFAPLLFSVSCSSLVPCSGTLSCCWPFQPLPFMPPLEAEEDVLYRVERMCSLQKANNPVRLFVFQWLPLVKFCCVRF